MKQQLREQLNHYRLAWPLIKAIQTRGTPDLIYILDHAEEPSLIAFAKCVREGDLFYLISVFLIKKRSELESVDRHRLIRFLRRPDLSHWLTQHMDLMATEASSLLSLHLMQLIFRPGTPEVTRWEKLRALLESYPFPLMNETIHALLHVHQRRNPQQPHPHVRLLLEDLLKRQEVPLAHEWVDALKQRHFLLNQLDRLCDQHRHTQEVAHNIWSTLECLSNESVYALLDQLGTKEQAFSVWEHLFNQDKTREALFSGAYDHEVHLFLSRHGADKCLAHYLLHYYDRPWFLTGLVYFLNTTDKKEAGNLLIQALTLLGTVPQLDKILMCFVTSEAHLASLLRDVFHDRLSLPIQQVSHPQISRMMPIFSKKHLFVALQVLNTTPSERFGFLHKWVLYFLKYQHHYLFPPQQGASKPFLLAEEQTTLCAFIQWHLSQESTFDKEFAIGHRVLGELIFRTAETGQIDLFYHEGVFNPQIARLSLNQAFLKHLVDKFWIPPGVKEQFLNPASRISTWLYAQLPPPIEMNLHPMLKDWRHLIQNIWGTQSNKKLPIICVYLLNYQGPQKSLSLLLTDYVHLFLKWPKYVHPVVHLLRTLPHREGSAVLFDVLEQTLIKTPDRLDQTILSAMADYYVSNIPQPKNDKEDASICLLIYFAHHQHYALVQKGCMVLMEHCEDKKLRKRLFKAAQEAAGKQNHSEEGRKEVFWRPFKKLWALVSHLFVSQSGITLSTNEDPPASPRKLISTDLKMPALSTELYLCFSEEHRQLIQLLATIRYCSILSSKVGQTMLYHTPVSTSRASETSVAESQPVVHI